MRWFITAALFSILLGIGCLFYAHRFPVYTDIKALERLQNEKFQMPSNKHDQERLYKNWYTGMHALETPYKRFSDLGRGLCAAGIGLFAAIGFWKWYHRPGRAANTGVILGLWATLWLIRIPFSLWYYGLRQWRTDYPWWADSIGIPLFTETFLFLIGAIVSTAILRALLKKHPPSATVQLVRPATPSGWLRVAFLGCWLALLVAGIATGIPDGDEGMVISFIIASVILLTFLMAPTLYPEERTFAVA